MQNIVNSGLYQAINTTLKENWKNRYISLTFFGILVLPFSIFHAFKYLQIKIFNYIMENDFAFNFHLTCKINKNSETMSFAEVYKNVPEQISTEDFYFDDDVEQIDQILKYG